MSQTQDAPPAAGDRDYAAEQRRWEERALRRALEVPGRLETFATGSGIELDTLYGPAQLEGHDPVTQVGFPGQPPFTRGIQSTMYRGRLWSIRQYAGYGTASDANQRFRFLLAHGQKGLSVAFDLPTQMGLDSDDERAAGEVGQVGVAIDSVADMVDLFDQIPLGVVSTSMTINAPAPVLVAMYMVAAERQGVPAAAVMGTAQNDVLKEYVARGTYIYPPRPSLRLAADLIAHCTREAPKFNAISLSGYHIREAGSTAPQEMAFAIANACEYVGAVVARGIAVDDFAPKLSWIFNTHTDFFEEIAKYRALRRLWGRVMTERFGATDPRSLMLRTHTQTGGSTLTAQQPENNIVRAAIQALAAVLGGVQSLALSCYDEALSIPTEKAQRIAVRTQQIIGEEIGVTNTVDPLGGSYFVEWLTDELERQAVALMAQVDERGGAVACIESGWMQEQIQEEAYLAERAVVAGAKVVVGVNRHTESEEAQPPLIFHPDQRAATEQLERLDARRANRDRGRVASALTQLRTAAEGDAELMPPIIDAVRAEATLGEICGTLRDVFGEYRPPATI
ncbi:MAG: methylmalonyl-CoA mutase [Candidatus Dormibacteraeota bacterium]|uniref:Methylmalonyl-CoA mutase n=1 Tax=Candidatus Amunia macphersoniae TaxID=3127014 RepID=A0A934KGV6_9BACT|nr:methylmalonyl-CoA mutase [Candidatus Dormibacteraeota bacterium]